MPCLASLVAGGVSGELTSVAPYLSPMLWTTIATGHHPDRHGVHGFAEVDPLTGEARAVGSASRRTQALWNVVSGQGGSAGVIGWMGSFPAERIHGVFVADEFAHAPANPSAAWPVPPAYIHPLWRKNWPTCVCDRMKSMRDCWDCSCPHCTPTAESSLEIRI